MKISIEARFDNAIAGLRKLDGKARQKGLLNAFTSAARIARDEAKKTTAFKDRTGLLRRSWSVQRKTKPYLKGVLRNKAPHGHFIEKGTKRMEAKPWIAPAIERTANRQIDAVAMSLTKYLEDVARTNRAGAARP